MLVELFSEGESLVSLDEPVTVGELLDTTEITFKATDNRSTQLPRSDREAILRMQERYGANIGYRPCGSFSVDQNGVQSGRVMIYKVLPVPPVEGPHVEDRRPDCGSHIDHKHPYAA